MLKKVAQRKISVQGLGPICHLTAFLSKSPSKGNWSPIIVNLLKFCAKMGTRVTRSCTSGTSRRSKLPTTPRAICTTTDGRSSTRRRRPTWSTWPQVQRFKRLIQTSCIFRMQLWQKVAAQKNKKIPISVETQLSACMRQTHQMHVVWISLK